MDQLKPLVILGYIVLKYSAWGMSLTNNILKDMVGSVFHHLPSGCEGDNIGIWIISRNRELDSIHLSLQKKKLDPVIRLDLIRSIQKGTLIDLINRRLGLNLPDWTWKFESDELGHLVTSSIQTEV